jgi:hypothetical protein
MLLSQFYLTLLLCCFGIHISKHVKARCKTYCKVKALNYKEGKEVKSKDVWKTIIDAWQAIVESESKETYFGFFRLFKIVCTTFKKKNVEDTILETVTVQYCTC